jgi:hypothetical protein
LVQRARARTQTTQTSDANANQLGSKFARTRPYLVQ